MSKTQSTENESNLNRNQFQWKLRRTVAETLPWNNLAKGNPARGISSILPLSTPNLITLNASASPELSNTVILPNSIYASICLSIGSSNSYGFSLNFGLISTLAYECVFGNFIQLGFRCFVILNVVMFVH